MSAPAHVPELQQLELRAVLGASIRRGVFEDLSSLLRDLTHGVVAVRASFDEHHNEITRIEVRSHCGMWHRINVGGRVAPLPRALTPTENRSTPDEYEGDLFGFLDRLNAQGAPAASPPLESVLVALWRATS